MVHIGSLKPTDRSLMERKNYIYLAELSLYIARRVGISPRESKLAVVALCELIVISLLRRQCVQLPNLGSLELREGRVRKTIRFCPTQKLLGWTGKTARAFTPRTVKLVDRLSLIGGLAEQKLIQECKREIAEERLKHIPGTFTKSQSYVRLSFLLYLQQDFPYQLSWVNPISQQEHSSTKIRTIIKTLYSRVCSEDFQSLVLLWLGVRDRKEAMRARRLSIYEIRKQWERAIDTLLLLLEFEEISVTLARDLQIIPKIMGSSVGEF